VLVTYRSEYGAEVLSWRASPVAHSWNESSLQAVSQRDVSVPVELLVPFQVAQTDSHDQLNGTHTDTTGDGTL